MNEILCIWKNLSLKRYCIFFNSQIKYKCHKVNRSVCAYFSLKYNNTVIWASEMNLLWKIKEIIRKKYWQTSGINIKFFLN